MGIKHDIVLSSVQLSKLVSEWHLVNVEKYVLYVCTNEFEINFIPNQQFVAIKQFFHRNKEFQKLNKKSQFFKYW